MGALRNRTGNVSSAKSVHVQVGIDAGQLGDFAAIAVAEWRTRDDGLYHHVRRLEQLPLHTSYPEVASRVVEILGGLERRSRERAEAGESEYKVLPVLDVTGVGRGLYDVLTERGVPVVPVTFTASDTLTERENGEWSCGKIVLVKNLLLSVQSGRMTLPDDESAETFIRELQSFRSSETRTGHTQYNAASGEHDDLITAVGLATLPGLHLPARPFVMISARRTRQEPSVSLSRLW